MTTKQYTFNGDSGSTQIKAKNPNAAAREYDRAVRTMKQLLAKIDRVGGYITIEEDGLVIERISPNVR